jgi:hypothetical protein
MTSVNQYRVYCIDEAQYVYVWSTETPTLCPNNHPNRAIDESLTTIVSTVGSKFVTAKDPTTGYYQTKGFTFDVPSGSPGDISTFEHSWPGDILIWLTEFNFDTDNIGDLMSIMAAPNTIIGVLTQNESASTTLLHVSSTVIDNVVRGLDLVISDGVNTDSVGIIQSIDKVNYTITMDTPTVNAFNAGSYVILNFNVIQDIHPCTAGPITIGSKGLTGKVLPANTLLRLIYKNNNGAAKKICIRLEYYLIN